jgi:hypothetical protein
MALGGLMLEPSNKDYWVILGCFSSNFALKQHSIVGALQLDVSLTEAWAYLGKVKNHSKDPVNFMDCTSTICLVRKWMFWASTETN